MKATVKFLVKEFIARWHTASVFIQSLFIKETRYPNFLIIGAQKAGTTYLHNIFRSIPEVFIPTIEGRSDPTEVRFFDERISYGLGWYLKLFLNRPERILGDKTPKYYLLPRHRIWLIRKLNPSVKIIFILRDPVKRAWSDSVMNLDRFNAIPYSPTSKSVYEKYLLRKIDRGLYYKHLKRWLDYFPRQQVYVGIYEDLISNPEVFVHQILDFLDIKADVSALPIYERVNANPEVGVPVEISKLLHPHFSSDRRALENYLKDRQFSHWYTPQ